MKTFLKATEFWLPSADNATLQFGGGTYDMDAPFRNITERLRFQYDQGLPGKAWAAGHPILLTEFEGSYFLRSEAAKRAGITTGIAMPIFAGEILLAVVVFFCGDDEECVGSMEIWHSDLERSYDLELADGYFGSLDHFEFISRRTALRKGVGLPGIAWENSMPLIMNDLGHSQRFIRSEEALKAGITTGLALPIQGLDPHQVYLMAFLSARNTPLARQIEIWVPSYTSLIFQSGYSADGRDLFSRYDGALLDKGIGAIGRAWLTGRPQIVQKIAMSDSDEEYSLQAFGFKHVVAIPILENAKVTSVVALYE